MIAQRWLFWYEQAGVRGQSFGMRVPHCEQLTSDSVRQSGSRTARSDAFHFKCLAQGQSDSLAS